MLIKEMTDAGVAEAIEVHRAAANGWDAMATAGHGKSVRSKLAGGVLKNLRLMDIAIAVKRSRIAAGTWSL
jgi:hypothetical protein